MNQPPDFPNVTGSARKRTPSGDIGILLDRMMTERGWTLRKLAEESGIDHQRINTYVIGKKRPSVDALTKLFHALGGNVHYEPPRVDILGPDGSLVLRLVPIEPPKLGELIAIKNNGIIPLSTEHSTGINGFSGHR